MTEQRDAERTELQDTTVDVIDVESGVEFHGRGLDVSASGLAFHAALEPALGADMKVSLKGARSLAGELHVTRVTRTPSGFDVAGRLSSR